VNYFLHREQKAKRSINCITAIDLVVGALVLISGHFNGVSQTLGNLSWLIFIGILVLVNIALFVDYFYSFTAVKKEKYRQAYLGEHIRFMIVAHVFDINGSGSPITISDHSKLKSWFYSKFAINKAFRDEIAISTSVVPGCYKKDLTFNANVRDYLSGHPIESVYFESIEAFNKRHSFISSSKVFKGEPEDGLTVLFICETSKLFFDDMVDSRVKALLLQKNSTAIALSEVFQCDGIRTHVATKIEFLPLIIK
jgi:hypothetical protein